MQEALLAYLLADTTLAGLIGSRMTWGVNDQGDPMPRVTLQRTSGSPEYSDEGEAGLSFESVQVDCFAMTYAQATAIGRAIRARVSGQFFTQDGVDFNVWIDTGPDEPEAFDGGREVHRVMITLRVSHNA